MLHKEGIFIHHGFKYLGLAFILIPLTMEVFTGFQKMDLAMNQLATGFIFIFFSRERHTDERDIVNKMRALSYGFYMCWATTGIVKLSTDYLLTAFELIACVGLIATCLFYVFKYRG